MADRLRPSAARLTPAALTLLARQSASTARAARSQGAPDVARAAARRALYYRDRRAVSSRGRRRAA
jgi:hypothetical protein